MIVFQASDKNIVLSVRDYLKQNNVDCVIEKSKDGYSVIIIKDEDIFMARRFLQQLSYDEHGKEKLMTSSWTQSSSDFGEHGSFTMSIKNWNISKNIFTFSISLLCMIVWIAQVFFDSDNRGVIFNTLCFDNQLIKDQYELWRLISPIFLHFSFWHIAFNLVIFIVFASKIEQCLGKTKLIFLLVSSAAIGNISQYIANDFNGNFGGISGVVNALIAYVSIVSLAKNIPANFKSIPGLLLVIIIFVFINLIFNFGVANACHVAGIIVGAIIGLVDYQSLNSGKKIFK